MISRKELLSRLDAALFEGRPDRGLDLIAAYVGAEHYLVMRDDGLSEGTLESVVASDWPFDLVRSLGLSILRLQSAGGDVARGLSTLLPVVASMPAAVRVPPGIGRTYAAVPFGVGRQPMLVALLFRDGIVIPHERVEEAGLLAAYCLDGMAGPAPREDRGFDLTEREVECLVWISEGKTSDEIATIIGISKNTVNNYITSIMKKTATRTRSEAIAFAVRNSLF